eukprot:9947628-Heterocapsa_arctica.AAC.1
MGLHLSGQRFRHLGVRPRQDEGPRFGGCPRSVPHGEVALGARAHQALGRPRTTPPGDRGQHRPPDIFEPGLGV